MDTGIVVGLVLLLVGGICAVLLLPLRERAIRKVRKVTREFGLVVTVERDPAKMSLDDLSFPFQFFFPTMDDVADPPSGLEEWWAWAHRRSGEDVGTTTIMITLQATADVSIVVDPPLIHAADYVVPPLGLIRSPDGVGGGGVRPRRFMVDLDATTPRAKYAPPIGDDRPPSFSLSSGDSERIQIVASVDKRDRRWWLELPITANGVKYVKEVGSQSAPFVTISWRGKPSRSFYGGNEGEDGPWSAVRTSDF